MTASDRAVRRALRDLEHARTNVRIGKAATGAAVTVLGLVVWGWVAAISWGMEGAGQPGVDKGMTMGGFIIGLIVCSIVALTAVGGAVFLLAAALDGRRDASEAYEDQILDGIS